MGDLGAGFPHPADLIGALLGDSIGVGFPGDSNNGGQPSIGGGGVFVSAGDVFSQMA